jgi:hypothetical protein
VEAMRGLSKGGKEGIGRQETRVQSGFRVERNGEIRRGEDRTEPLPAYRVSRTGVKVRFCRWCWGFGRFLTFGDRKTKKNRTKKSILRLITLGHLFTTLFTWNKRITQHKQVQVLRVQEKCRYCHKRTKNC